jgi:hypothetical protein
VKCPPEKRVGKLGDVEAIGEQIPAAEMERMMKIQEVILKAMSGKLKWWEGMCCEVESEYARCC